MREYDLNVPGLAEAVVASKPDKGHKALVNAIQRLPGLENVRLATTRHEDGGSYLHAHAVYSAAGDRVHDDHEAWLRGELAADGGNALTTYRRLQPLGYQLARTNIVDLHLVADQGGEQDNFWQLLVQLQDERLECQLLGSFPSTKERDLLDEAVGYELPVDQQRRLGTPSYKLVRAINMQRFMQLVDQLDLQQKAQLRARQYVATNDDGSERVLSHGELDRDFDRYPCRARRLFNDWSASSAGRSGARLCEHWIMDTSDWTDPKTSERFVDLVPAWTFSKPVAKVDAHKGDAYTFYGKLQTLDRRVGVPFGWYFYMLHGNKVKDDAGHRAIKAAEEGLIVMPEHDYGVLRTWRDRTYGF